MDFTNPGAVKWFNEQLDQVVKNYGVDGFKFDAGDMGYYSNIVSYEKISPNSGTRATHPVITIYLLCACLL